MFVYSRKEKYLTHFSIEIWVRVVYVMLKNRTVNRNDIKKHEVGHVVCGYVLWNAITAKLGD